MQKLTESRLCKNKKTLSKSYLSTKRIGGFALRTVRIHNENLPRERNIPNHMDGLDLRANH